MSDLALFNDYYEQWQPNKPSCADCIHMVNPEPFHWQKPSHCTLLNREVERACGHCSQFKAGKTEARKVTK